MGFLKFPLCTLSVDCVFHTVHCTGTRGITYPYLSCILHIWNLSKNAWLLSLSAGATMRVILDIGGSLAITVSACTVILYTLLGGLYSVAYTDVIQMVFITLSLVSPVHFFGTSFLTKGKGPALLFSMSQIKNNFLDLQFLLKRTGFLKIVTVFMSLCTLCISDSVHISHWPRWVNTKRSARKWSLQNLSRTSWMEGDLSTECTN